MKQEVLIAISALVLASCAADADKQTRPRDLPVESFVLVEVEDINSRVAAAAAAGEQWPLDALSVAGSFVGPAGNSYVSIEKVDELGESPTTSTITIIRGRDLDDSVWGVWDQLLLSRQADGTWHVAEARRAWRCYRGHQTESFGERWCS